MGVKWKAINAQNNNTCLATTCGGSWGGRNPERKNLAAQAELSEL
jgi:hypothetical protein